MFVCLFFFVCFFFFLFLFFFFFFCVCVCVCVVFRVCVCVCACVRACTRASVIDGWAEVSEAIAGCVCWEGRFRYVQSS